MKKWCVDYSFRIGDKYEEDRIYVEARFLDEAFFRADTVLNTMWHDENWDAFFIWNIGIMADADEEMC